MRLISLTSNKESFKTVGFRPSGLTLIVGRHVSKSRSDIKKTYNGVGKSLIVALVNYCLGSNKNEQFDSHLPGWSFTLDFEHAGIAHSVTRSTNEAKLVFDGDELTLTKYKDRLESLKVFDLPESDVPYLTFRSLLSFFLRPRASSYVHYNRPQPEAKEYQSLLCQSFLLGLDYRWVVQKHNHKQHLDRQLESAERYKKDKELKEFYLGEKNAEVELRELGTRIKSLASSLESFQVAEDYSARRAHADQLHAELEQLGNEVTIEKNLIEDIELALKVKPDVAPELVVRMYRELQVVLPAMVVKRLSEVESFHRRLQENRDQRLKAECSEAQARLESLQRTAAKKRQELDDDLHFLNAHGALDEYAANSARLSDLRSREQRIRDYLQLLSQYTEEAQKTRAKMAQDTVDASHYLRDVRPHTDMLMDAFRAIAQALYGDVPSGITIANNDGENQCRFDIEARIQNDAADGINQGKIFCHDFLLLTNRQRHSMDVLFHDSRLFADMDKNQRYSLFSLASRVCQERNLQYIATVNEDVLDSVKEAAGSKFSESFENSIVLELTDAPHGIGKLLGIQVDMNYDE